MREYLFRGKCSNEWRYGYVIKGRKGDTAVIKWYNDYFDEWETSVVDPETVGQYTGLKDKNGVKIFEGDILKQKTTPEFAKVNSFEWELYGVVRFGYYDWDEGEGGCASMGWYIEPLKSVSIKPKNYLVGHIQAGLNQCDILNKYYPMEVIGNIHDNRELMKEGGEE